MLNIVLPMAGKGSRFSNAGYSLPKPFIKVDDRPMIQVVVENLRPECEHRFIFICQKEHISKYRADALLKSITDNPVVIGIDGYTEGQLCSALLAKPYIDNDDQLMTANTDQYIDFDVDEYLETIFSKDLDGLIMTMNANDPKWSYVRIDPDTDLVIETAEKKVISNEATVGIYNFKRGKDFCYAAEEIIKEDLRVNGEFYICPCYNKLIEAGKKIGYFNIGSERSGMYGLGIPEDLEWVKSKGIIK